MQTEQLLPTVYYNTLIIVLIDTSLTIWLSLNTNTYWNMLKWRDFIYYIHADLEISSPNFCHQNKMISILKISDTQKHQNFVMTATKYCNISIQTIYKTIFLKNFDLHFPLCVQFILKAEGRGQSYTADILRKYFSLQKSQETNRGHQLL